MIVKNIKLEKNITKKSDMNIEIIKTFDNEKKKYLFTPRGDSL